MTDWTEGLHRDVRCLVRDVLLDDDAPASNATVGSWSARRIGVRGGRRWAVLNRDGQIDRIVSADIHGIIRREV